MSEPKADINSRADVGKRLAYYRKLKGLSQIELAEKVGVARSSICNIEKGLAYPAIDKLSLLIDELGISANDVIESQAVGNTIRVVDEIISLESRIQAAVSLLSGGATHIYK